MLVLKTTDTPTQGETMQRTGLSKRSAADLCARAVTTLMLLSMPLMIAVCGGDSIIEPADNMIGPEGGTVTDGGGASVTIPPGALTGEVEITVSTLPEKDDLPEESQTFLPLLGGAEFGPSGTTFDVPAVITIPVDPPLGSGEEAAVFFWDETEGAWREVEGDVTVAPGGGAVSVEVTHFSLFSAVTDVFDDFQANFRDGSTAGTAVTTFTAGDDEGTESVRASLTTCKGQETPDGAAQMEIGGDWTADMNIAFNQTEGDEPLYSFTDDVSISMNLSIEEGVVTGTGTGSHNVDLSIAGNCSEQDMYAPSFPVIVTGARTGDNLEFMVIAMSIPLSFTLHCVWDDVEDDFPYPIFSLLESSIMAQYIQVTVPLQDGATDSGSGSDPAGGDTPMTWDYSVTLHGS